MIVPVGHFFSTDKLQDRCKIKEGVINRTLDRRSNEAAKVQFLPEVAECLLLHSCPGGSGHKFQFFVLFSAVGGSKKLSNEAVLAKKGGCFATNRVLIQSYLFILTMPAKELSAAQHSTALIQNGCRRCCSNS